MEVVFCLVFAEVWYIGNEKDAFLSHCRGDVGKVEWWL